MRILACGLLAVVGLVAGCGERPTPPQSQPSPQQSPAGTTGTLVIAQQGTPPARTVWYARIETTDAKPLAEASYRDGPIDLTRELAPGDYRVISWHRVCTAECPAGGEAGLGPLEEVCGALVSVAAGTRVIATVVMDAEGTCGIET